jgi:RNA ligase
MSNITIADLVNMDELRTAIEARLINVRSADDGQLIYNYSDAAMYTPGAWDSMAVRICRGLITDPDGVIVARPWVKFFNHGQAEAGTLDLDAPVEVTDKIDGSLGVLHLDESGAIRVATRGSFESDQAAHATARLNEMDYVTTWDAEITPLVEIVYPENRIVCDYGTDDYLILLGGVVTQTGDYLSPAEVSNRIGWCGPITVTFPYDSLKAALEAPPRRGAEGMCVRYLDENRIVKVKQEDYIALHRIVTRLSEKTVWRHLLDGGTLTGMLAGLPDELHPWTRDVAEGLILDTWDTADRARHVFSTIEAESRKDFAEQALRFPEKALLFMLYDGKPVENAILRTLEPRGDARAKHITEDVA